MRFHRRCSSASRRRNAVQCRTMYDDSANADSAIDDDTETLIRYDEVPTLHERQVLKLSKIVLASCLFEPDVISTTWGL